MRIRVALSVLIRCAPFGVSDRTLRGQGFLANNSLEDKAQVDAWLPMKLGAIASAVLIGVLNIMCP